MFSHVMIGSNDIERSKRFYDALLGVLGVGEPLRNVAKTGHTRLFYRHDGGTFCVSAIVTSPLLPRAMPKAMPSIPSPASASTINNW